MRLLVESKLNILRFASNFSSFFLYFNFILRILNY